MKNMIKKFLIVAVTVFLLTTPSLGTDYDYNSYIKYLQDKGININKDILNKQAISRYEVVKYLNYARCFDCIYPPKEIKNKFNLNWFNNFKKQKKFYLQDITITDPYYYCITNLASLDYIHGYPKSNPVCGGKFCGVNGMYYGELLQVVLNILSDKISTHYYINDVNKFYNKLLSIKGTQKQKQVNILDSDYNIIKKIKNSGKNIYQISSFDEFYLYQKYCNLFPEDCNFKEFGDIKKGSYMLSLVNILYKENLLTLNEAFNIDSQKIISGKDVVRWLYKLKSIMNCKIDNDYDKDNILNKDDNCMYTYNPNQKDTNKDGIGDVCDDDIDGDGIKNAIGVVDDEGNINTEKAKKCKTCPSNDDNCSCDNCIFTKNTNQTDLNNNGIGDACENKGNYTIGIKIICSPVSGYAPLQTNCTAFTVGNVKKVVWTYKGNIIGEGKNIQYTLLKQGHHEIIATAIGENNDIARASSHIKLKQKESNTNLNVGLQIKATPSIAIVGNRITFTKEIKGDLDKIKWYFGDGSSYIRDPKTNPIKIYAKPGFYKVLALGIKNNKIVTKSYEYVTIYTRYKKQPSSYLQAQPLLSYVNQDISLILNTKNIDTKDIDYITWIFGDGSKKNTNTLYTTHNFKKIGTYPIQAIIFLKNGKKLDNMITEKVIDNKVLTKYGANIVGKPLMQKIGKKVDFTILPKGFFIKDVDNIVWLWGDGTKNQSKNFSNSHIYHKAGKKHVVTNIYLKNGEHIVTSLTVAIIGNNICSNIEEAKKLLKCDMDHDGIPDMCDNDIDGDGVKNFLGLILYEKKDCSIGPDNLDPNRNSEENENARNGGNIDNCPYQVNPKQEDKNNNGYGDTCDNSDRDGDDIKDIDDYCPDIPENINGIEDEDGCPEIKIPGNKPKFMIENCNTCPCQFADYATPFIPGSLIKAILVNPNNPNIYYRYSDYARY